jgi:hypothetical protein
MLSAADTAPVTQISHVGETRNSSRGSNASALKYDGSAGFVLSRDRSGCREICSLILGVDTMMLLYLFRRSFS